VAETSANVLAGKRVVVTRAVEQSESLVRALREKGAVPVSLPMITFAPPDDLAPLDAAIHRLNQNDWLLLTSQNALRALRERCQQLGLSLVEAAAGVQIAVVGPATAEAATSAGLPVAYVARQHQGVSLAEEFAPQLKGMQVLLPRSDHANPELVEVLQRLGARVVEITAYKTIRPDSEQTPDCERALREDVDAVLFFSPSAVHHLRELVGDAQFRTLSRISAFTAIGPITEHALREAGVDRVLLARDTTVPSILDALTEFFQHSEQAGVKRA
jgi:uroporphyrinogen-III synthase